MNQYTRLALALLIILIAGLLACSSSVAPCSPTEEVCNGWDDDCDGIVDNNLTDVTGDPCGEDEGECQSGHQACIDGEIGCEGEIGPSDEVCNYADDDCDGETDEDLTACACTGGNPPGTEDCNEIDDDCDEAVDENLTRPCDNLCGEGFEECVEGMWANCTAPQPGTETCNATDDDCDGETDEDLTACGCTGGVPPTDEVCNAIDDDCDGAVDENLTNCRCSGGNPPTNETCNGVDDDCNEAIDDGLSNCQCTGGNPPEDEICDGIDNDCDEQIDENSITGGGCAGFGEPCDSFHDCASQICVGDNFLRYCSMECDSSDPGSCPADYRCYIGPNLDYCLYNFSNCDFHTDCPAGEVCTVHTADDGLSKVTECRPPLDPGGDPGDDCTDTGCANDLCTFIDVCSEVCSDVAHCTNQYLGEDTTCVMYPKWILPGECGRDEQCPAGYTCQAASCVGPSCTDDAECETGYACDTADTQTCLPRSFYDYVGQCMIGCMHDGDCPVEMICLPRVLVDLSQIQGICSNPLSGNPTGASCDPGCDHGICFYSGGNSFCSQLCQNANHCPFGMTCEGGTMYMGSLGEFPGTLTCVYP